MKKAEDLKITIITVCKNSELFLNETIKSVINQTYQNIQYIVIDGNSTDTTLDIIKSHSEKIDLWISEEDDGMYDAINKGLKLSVGNYILILNSDDRLVNDETIKNIVDQINRERLDYYYGNMIKSKRGKNKKVALFPTNFKQLLLSTHGTFVPHPCFLISAELNNALKGYDQQYKYAADYDYILRALSTADSKGKHLDVYISIFRIHENSITASGKINEERKKIILRHGYFQYSYFRRWSSYYLIWIYYKLINLGKRYKNTQG